jgi:hypothetical protein
LPRKDYRSEPYPFGAEDGIVKFRWGVFGLIGDCPDRIREILEVKALLVLRHTSTFHDGSKSSGLTLGSLVAATKGVEATDGSRGANPISGLIGASDRRQS